jgi:hypothetical protein
MVHLFQIINHALAGIWSAFWFWKWFLLIATYFSAHP